MAYRWRNALIVEHPNLPGKATASEKSFLFHKSAIGHAANTGEVDTDVGLQRRAELFVCSRLDLHGREVAPEHGRGS